MEKQKVLIIEGNRSGYGVDQVIDYTLTVGELIQKLSNFDLDTKIVLGNDKQRYGYYTYGEVDIIHSVEVDEEGNFEVEDMEEIY